MRSDLPISIVIPNLHSPMVDRTIESVKKQKYPVKDLEILVVGLDRHGLVKQDHQVRMISTDRPVGPATARNIGIKHSRGENIIFIDADCVADTHWLGRHLCSLDEGNDLVGGGVAFDKGNYWTLCDNVMSFHEYLATKKRRDRRYFPTINLSIRREVLQKVGGFDEDLRTAEDLDLTVRCHLAGCKLRFEPLALVHHYPHRASFKALLEHARDFGANSLRVRRRYPEVFPFPRFLAHPTALVGLSPLLALYGTARIFLANPASLTYWHTIPVIYVAKLAWCVGASRGVHPGGGPNGGSVVPPAVDSLPNLLDPSSK